MRTSEVWPFLKFAFLPVIAGFGLWVARRIQKEWLRQLLKATALFLLIFFTFFLFSSLPTGSVDICDLGLSLDLVGTSLIGLIGFVLARRIGLGWIRVSVKTTTSFVFVPSTLLLLFFLLMEPSCIRRAPPIYSPDGKYMALVRTVGQGALGDDYANIYVRRSWSPFFTHVYSGLGAWNFSHNEPWDPEVRWLDDSHLLIRYSDVRTGKEGRGGPAMCRSKAGNVGIVCENLTPSLRSWYKREAFP